MRLFEQSLVQFQLAINSLPKAPEHSLHIKAAQGLFPGYDVHGATLLWRLREFIKNMQLASVTRNVPRHIHLLSANVAIGSPQHSQIHYKGHDCSSGPSVPDSNWLPQPGPRETRLSVFTVSCGDCPAQHQDPSQCLQSLLTAVKILPKWLVTDTNTNRTSKCSELFIFDSRQYGTYK